MRNEVPLSGGNVTPVVRIGNAVHRVPGPWSASIHQLLRHLQQENFGGAPRFLGFDDEGREMLSYIEGEVGHFPAPAYVWSEATLTAMAQLIRRYHDATADYIAPAGGVWQITYPDSMQHEVICHNDIAPYNVVFERQRPHALFDFDVAGPGPRRWDMAYAAYRFVPLEHTDEAWLERLRLTEPATQGVRLQLFCDAYGISAQQVLATVEERVEALCTFITNAAANGNIAFQRQIQEGHLAHYERELVTLRDSLPQIAQALST